MQKILVNLDLSLVATDVQDGQTYNTTAIYAYAVDDIKLANIVAKEILEKSLNLMIYIHLIGIIQKVIDGTLTINFWHKLQSLKK